MSRHANTRVYLGPNTSEIIIPISRSFGVRSNFDSISIEFTRRKIGAAVISTWATYVIQGDNAHFEIPEEFRTDAITFPKGFYDGVVSIGDCVVGNIELIKSPGHYVGKGSSIEGRCDETNTWVEPDCADDEFPDPCVCVCDTPVDNCPTCYNTNVLPCVVEDTNYVDLTEED